MSRKSKLIERLQQRPRDFTWDEMCSLMKMCGFTLLKGAGSRRKFVHETTRTKVFIHQPHPNPVLKSYAINELIETLRRTGHIQ